MLEYLFNVTLLKRLPYKCFPVNIAKSLRTPISKNSCERLLLNFWLVLCKLLRSVWRSLLKNNRGRKIYLTCHWIREIIFFIDTLNFFYLLLGCTEANSRPLSKLQPTYPILITAFYLDSIEVDFFNPVERLVSFEPATFRFWCKVLIHWASHAFSVLADIWSLLYKKLSRNIFKCEWKLRIQIYFLVIFCKHWKIWLRGAIISQIKPLAMNVFWVLAMYVKLISGQSLDNLWLFNVFMGYRNGAYAWNVFI